jgi:hypothetical protein
MSDNPSKRLKVEEKREGGNDTPPEDEFQPRSTSSPVELNRQNVVYTILPHEYSIIEDDNNGWNADEAFSEVY